MPSIKTSKRHQSLILLFLLLQDCNHGAVFQDTLSAIQQHSLSIILDWLDATYQSPDRVSNLLALIAIHSVYELPRPLWQAKRDWALGDKQYGDTMYTLFNFEFTYTPKLSRSKAVFPMDLNATRNRASAQAYVQWMGSRCLAASATDANANQVLSSIPQSPNPLHTYSQIPHILSEGRRIIETDWNIELSELVTTDPEAPSREESIEKAMLLLSSALHHSTLFSKSRLEQGPLVSFAAWLPSEERSGYPHYLWDAQLGRTIIFLDNPICYAAISHTWGRWRPKGEACIEVPGVPWPVPVNTRFRVSNIPQLLKSCSRVLSCQYIWFDLVCIPPEALFGEDGDTWESIKRREIRRQAHIFISTTKIVAWFPDIVSLIEIRELARYMALNCVTGPRSETETYKTILNNAWKSIQGKQIEWFVKMECSLIELMPLMAGSPRSGLFKKSLYALT